MENVLFGMQEILPSTLEMACIMHGFGTQPQLQVACVVGCASVLVGTS